MICIQVGSSRVTDGPSAREASGICTSVQKVVRYRRHALSLNVTLQEAYHLHSMHAWMSSLT